MHQKTKNIKNKKDCVEKSNAEDSIIDLQTARGQILFLIIAICTSSALQLVPFGEIKQKLFSNEKVAHESDSLCPVPDVRPEVPATRSPLYWVYTSDPITGHLRHVYFTLERLGFEKASNNSDWDLLWAHDFPFRAIDGLKILKPHQRVNHFPGSGFISNKVDLATTDLTYIPKSFKLPADEKPFREYAVDNPGKLFVQKHYQHRHIKIKPIEEIDFANNESFIQEFIENPLLIDGYKFDIGVYTIITSVNPLRLYIHTGDVLFRYCQEKYYPFDGQNTKKYIIGDDYRPTWEVPSLTNYYNNLGFGMKASFDAHLESQGRNSSHVWHQVEDAIRLIVLKKEPLIIQNLATYKSKRNFFEMMRFDLIVDNDLKVYLMEANMSPNLSSAHFKQNTLLYEQIIYSVMNLVGIGSPLSRESLRKRINATEEMVSAEKNLVVNPLECAKNVCSKMCDSVECSLCLSCMTPSNLDVFHAAYREHMSRGETKRIFPVPIKPEQSIDEEYLKSLLPANQLITLWFHGKCKMESNWCS